MPFDKERICEEVMQILQGVALNRDIRRADADAALTELIRNIISIGMVALTEEQAVECYRAGANMLDAKLNTIVREANKTAQEAARQRRRGGR